MRPLKLGLALAAVVAFAAAPSTTAFALTLPENLPASGTTRTWTGAAIGEPKLEGGELEPVTCKEAPAEGTEAPGKPEGAFHVQFKGCKTTTTHVTCTGLADASGVILALGTWHLVFDTLGTGEALHTAFLFELEPLHFTCAIVLVKVTGTLLCLHLGATVKAFTHESHCTESGGVSEDKEYFMDNSEALAVQLLCAGNEGAATECALLSLGSVTYKEEVFADA